ncbi:MAG: hypothetical protein A2934_01225 [Candidatus Sungbacteria bacterium RIFCSPLOWO2_01_FULL_47_10]|uniref:Uncharacterized protein n=1 Tax=Candidatus Sungbacteria bacterium RIFCSPLOWO2_01_FULL_47_10 TaxID=1802276 RepID=A0A1G2L0Y0_9BACT|nr:MAG: hypothetical protein A2934_01225 [Candidatus Sungbacteria bacterium RIFCSPLOWO2_01_FULL_47_10]
MNYTCRSDPSTQAFFLYGLKIMKFCLMGFILQKNAFKKFRQEAEFSCSLLCPVSSRFRYKIHKNLIFIL